MTKYEPLPPSKKSRAYAAVKWDVDTVEALATDLDEWIADSGEMLLESWLKRHKLHYEHFGMFCQKSPIFLDSYTRARMEIDRRLIEAALTRKIDINALKFYLMNRSHNWKDKPDIAINQTTTQLSLSELLTEIDGASKTLIQVKTQTPEPENK